MKLSKPRFLGASVVIALLSLFFVGVTVSVANGELALSQNLEAKREHSQRQIEKTLKEEIVPLANRLSPLLGKLLPKEKGTYYPIELVYAPSDSDKPRRATFHCPWGATICEPFLQACAALQESCSCSDYGAIEPDPC